MYIDNISAAAKPQRLIAAIRIMRKSAKHQQQLDVLRVFANREILPDLIPLPPILSPPCDKIRNRESRLVGPDRGINLQHSRPILSWSETSDPRRDSARSLIRPVQPPYRLRRPDSTAMTVHFRLSIRLISKD